jgi:uncharacterized protein (DUF983 family)
MKAEASKPNLILSVLANKCPRCRRGDLFENSYPYHFKTTMHMPEHCPCCGQRFELQTGFYFGTGFVSYGLSVLLLGMVFIIWALTIGMSYRDNRVFWCLGTGIAILVLLQPVLQRLARSIWIAFFVKYDKDWALTKGSTEIFR